MAQKIESAHSKGESVHTPVRFCDLEIGARFEFRTKTDVGCGKYNAVFTKTMPGAYRGECFTGYPQTGVEVLRISTPPETAAERDRLRERVGEIEPDDDGKMSRYEWRKLALSRYAEMETAREQVKTLQAALNRIAFEPSLDMSATARQVLREIQVCAKTAIASVEAQQ